MIKYYKLRFLLIASAVLFFFSFFFAILPTGLTIRLVTQRNFTRSTSHFHHLDLMIARRTFLVSIRNTAFKPQDGASDWFFFDISYTLDMSSVDPLAPVIPPAYTLSPKFPTISHFVYNTPYYKGYTVWQYLFVVPMWIFCVIFLVFVLLTRRKLCHLRDRYRNRTLTCVECGYDLRATPERCPECGAVPKRIETTTTQVEGVANETGK